MATTTNRITAEVYFATSEERHHIELIDGFVVVNEPKPIHGVLQVRLLFGLEAWIRSAPGHGVLVPPVDVQTGERDVYGPDISWIAKRPADLGQRLARVPELCVEIRSSGTWKHDVGRKKATYEAAGLAELWLVDDVAEVVLVYRRSTPDAATFDVELELTRAGTLTSPQLPGFGLELEELFGSLP